MSTAATDDSLPRDACTAAQPSRRGFLGAASFGAWAVASGQALAESPPPLATSSEDIVDVNVSVFRWPFRRLPCDEVPRLVETLQEHGVAAAWAGTFEGVFHRDVRGANARLAATCRNAPAELLIPFGSINPKLADWRRDLDLCTREHGMPGVRLHPNYHGYDLNDPRFAELMDAANERRLIVQIVVHLEDERMMSPLARVKPVDLEPLERLAPHWLAASVVLLNAFGPARRDLLVRLLAQPNVLADIATLEGAGALETLLGEVEHTNILLGSHAPLFYWEAAALKLVESACGAVPTRAILRENATRILANAKKVPS